MPIVKKGLIGQPTNQRGSNKLLITVIILGAVLVADLVLLFWVNTHKNPANNSSAVPAFNQPVNAQTAPAAQEFAMARANDVLFPGKNLTPEQAKASADEAVGLLEQVNQVAPNNPQTLSNLGRAYIVQSMQAGAPTDSLTKAETVFRQGITVQAKVGQKIIVPYRQLAWLYIYKLNQPDKALEPINQGIKIDSTYPDWYAFLVDIYKAKGDTVNVKKYQALFDKYATPVVAKPVAKPASPAGGPATTKVAPKK